MASGLIFDEEGHDITMDALSEAVEDDKTPDAVLYAHYLRSLATHFVHQPWDYTRVEQVQNPIQRIRYADDWSGYHRIDRRIRRALGGLFKPTHAFWGHFNDDKPWYHRLYLSLLSRVVMAWVYLKTDRHLPDGVLDGGGVLTYWEETGEYLQMVQPSVGELLADFLIAEPDHPHAKKILAELGAISERYTARARAGEVDGRGASEAG